MINKRIWTTGAILIIVIFAALLINRRANERNEALEGPDTALTAEAEERPEQTGQGEEPDKSGDPATDEPEIPEPADLTVVPDETGEYGNIFQTEVTVETGLFTAVLSNKGGVLTSFVMHEYSGSEGTPVDLVLSEDSGIYPFTLHFGTIENPPADDLFVAEKSRASGRTTVEFRRKYRINDGTPFILVKRYIFKESEYLFFHEVVFEQADTNGPEPTEVPYALELGPQIGPDYKVLNVRTDYRHFIYQSQQKKRSISTAGDSISGVDDLFGWCGIEGKYFALLTVPPRDEYNLYLDSRAREGIRLRSALVLQKRGVDADAAGRLPVYLGPRKKEFLLRYNSADSNSFGVSGLQLDRSLSEPRLIGRIANVLKSILRLFYALIPNYGVAIVLLALIVRAALFPLALRQERMKTKAFLVEKKAEEIKKKYPEDYSKAQREIRELYQRERIRPVSRMLPLLIQLPILFALYHLLSTHFDLRGAAFIGGWISDLSQPDVVAEFFPKTLPVLNWHSFNLLPLLLLGLMLVQSRVTQPPPEDNRMQNIFSYLFPVLIFLIMYNLPSGLVLYFFLYTGLGIVQHYVIERYREELINSKIQFNY